MNKIEFKSIMYGYAAETTSSKKVKVFIPEIFLDKNIDDIRILSKSRGSNNIFINNTQPAVSAFVKEMNYITLPVASLNNITINKNDKLILSFIDNNPVNGAIIGKVD